MTNKWKNLVIVRGGGDLATGTIHKLHRSGFLVLVLETARPSAIRRYVAFSEAVYQGKMTIEGITCCYLGIIPGEEAAEDEWNALEFRIAETLEQGKIPLVCDRKGALIKRLKPVAVVDAIIAKKNLGTSMDMAPITIALGPGFTAGKDVHTVIETKRGHNLGRLIYEGEAAPNSGIPGIIEGFGRERVNHAECAGIFYGVRKISDLVSKGEIIAVIRKIDEEGNETGEEVPVKAQLSGVLRGILPDGYRIPKGFKIADIDPRVGEQKNCFTISDKARCIAGGVLEALCAGLLRM